MDIFEFDISPESEVPAKMLGLGSCAFTSDRK